LLLVLVLLLLLGALLLLPVLVLLLFLLLLLGFLLLRSPLLFRLVLFFVLLILLSVTQGRGSEKRKQNCCADDSNTFHKCCLDISLRAAGVINCLLLTRELMASDRERAG
jgi:O-antigen ligase